MSGDVIYVIGNDGGAIGARLDGLGPFDHEELLTAAQVILDSELHGDDACDCTTESIVAEARVVIYREHLTSPDGCGCEDVGWFCDQGDGNRSAWLWWDA